MGYSSLASVQIWSPCKTSPRNHTIDSVAIHCMAGNLTARACGQLFASASRSASSNYGVDSDGVIGVYVDENDRSWCTSSSGVDNRAVTIEVANTTASEPYEVTDAAYESLIKLLVDICQRNNIKSLKWQGDKDYAQSAANGGSVEKQNMFVHRWFAQKSCPGEYLYGKQGAIATEVNKRLGNNESYGDGVTTAGTTTTDSDDGSTTTTATTITVNYEEIDPYIVTLSRKSMVKYASLKDNGVFGAVVEAGYYMQTNGLIASKFENPNLAKQISNLDKAEIPYGLYMTCRARNSIEAKAEMYAFSFPIRRFSPKLGVWLKLEISNKNNVNTPILKEYRKQLTRLGFKGKMGIICNRDFVSHIEWDTKSKFKDDFYLWLVDHVKDTSEFTKLLDPEFFDIDGEG